MINLEKLNRKSASSHLLRTPAPERYFQPLYLIFQIHPSEEGHQSLLLPPLKRWWSKLCLFDSFNFQPC